MLNKIKDFLMAVSIVVIGVASFIAFVYGLSMLGYKMYAYFTPKYANVQNKIYQNNASYNEGMVRDFENLKLEYMREDDMNKKEAIHSVILHRFSVYGIEKLPPDLQAFYHQMEEQP